MTDEYKHTMLDYLTGNLKQEHGTDEEIFKEIYDIPRTRWESNNILPDHWNNFKYEGLIQVQNSDLLVLYGGYKTSDNEVRGIITIVDNEFNPITSIYQYNSGVYLRYIQCMRQDEDGKFYAIDCLDYPHDKNWSFTTSQKRFIMLNNFTQKINDNYNLNLQKSYILPTDYFNFYCKKIFKDTSSSYFIIVGNYLRDQNSPDYDGIRIIELKINVGSENEWNKIDDDGTGWLMGDSYVGFQNDKYYLRILLNDTATKSRDLYLWTKDYSQSYPSLKSIKSFSFHPFVDSDNYQNQSVFINKNELYFVQNNQRWGRPNLPDAKYIGLYYYNDETKENKIIYEKYLGDYDYCNLESIYIAQNNNEIYIEFNNNIDSTNNLSDYYCQRLINYKWNPILINKQQYFIFNQRFFYISNNFNLLKIIMHPTNPRGQTWKLYNIKENYNSSNYNGEPYVNDNALIPNSAELYSDSELIFARNLYNKTINDNVTVSTVEIPNTYLNNVNITNKNLLSQTNLHLVKDNNLLQKNIYETVFLNFINAVQVLNKDTETINRQAGVYLNAKINDEKGYDNAKITKVRIRSMEGTETVQSVQIDYPNETVSSTNPQLTNSANAELNSIKIDGKTVQNGTPTPDNPVEIKNVKGYKNLWELRPSQTHFGVTYTNNDGRNFSLKGTATGEATIPNFVPLSNFKDGEKYTLTCNKIQEGLQFRVEEYTEDNKWIRSYGTLKSDNLTLTISKSTGYYVRLAIIVLKNTTINLSNIEIQMIEGSEEKPYVPFGSNYLKLSSTNGADTNSIFLNLKDNELAQNDFVKIANNYGTIYKTSKKIIIDENSGMTYDAASSTDEYNKFTGNVLNGHKDNSLYDTICTHYKSGNAIINSQRAGSGNYKELLIIWTDKSITSTEQFNEFLKTQKENGTPVTVQYDLATPYTIDLGMQDSIYSYEGTTNISVDDELTPNIEVNYRLEGNYCILTVGIKVKEPLYQLEFISNDETNVYHTVDLSNLEVGKYYIIKEKLEVL